MKLYVVSYYQISLSVLLNIELENVAPPFNLDEDIFNRDLHMLGIDIMDPELKDRIEKDPEESGTKNLWLFNIRDDPNEGLIIHLLFRQQKIET